MLNSLKYITVIPFSGLINWSVQYLNETRISFNKRFPLVQIGDLLIRNKTVVSIEDEVKYKRVTIKMRNGGIFLRDEVMGNKIGTKNQFLISAGQFLLSKIDARNGAFGVVPDKLDGSIITGNFWTFDVDYKRVNPHYLALLTTTKAFVNFCEQASNGTTNRHYLQESLFLNIKIPLPSLDEQDDLVKKYNEIANVGYSNFNKGQKKAKDTSKYIMESIGLSTVHQNDILDDCSAFEIVSFSKIQEWGVDKILHSNVYMSSIYITTNMNIDNSLYIDIKRGKSPKYDKSSDVIILNQKCIRWNNIDKQYAKTVNTAWINSIDENCFTREGDILINSTGEGTIGRASIVDQDNSGLLYDSHILLLRLNKEKISPKYFVNIFNSKYGQEQVDNVKSAKTTKQTELGVENLKKIYIPIPPLHIQEEIIGKLDMMQAEVQELQNIEPYIKEAINNFEIQIFENY